MNLIENLHITTQRNKAPKNALCFTRQDLNLIDGKILNTIWQIDKFKHCSIRDYIETINYLKEWRLSLKYSEYMFVWFGKD